MRWCFCACGLFLLIGCGELNERAVPLPDDGAELPILEIASGTFSHEDRPMRLVVRDAGMLAQVPLVDIPVDFREQMVLIVTLGRRLSDQYAVRINRVYRDGPRLRVDYEITVPPPDAPLVVSSPFCMAVVAKCDLNVEDFSPTLPLRRPRLPEALREQRDLPSDVGTGSRGRPQTQRGPANVGRRR